MKARPHGASVVPSVATATSTASRVSGMPGTTRPLRGRAPVGMREEAGDDVGDEDALSASSTCSTRWKDPRRTSSETPRAASGTLT